MVRLPDYQAMFTGLPSCLALNSEQRADQLECALPRRRFGLGIIIQDAALTRFCVAKGISV